MAMIPPLTPVNPTGTVALNDSVKTAYSLTANFALRSNPLFEMIADVRSTNQTHSGSGVQFTFYTDMTQATANLAEAVDVTPVVLADSALSVTLEEYGNAVLTTAKVRGTSFLNVDADAASLVSWNMVDSMDKVVSDIANGTRATANVTRVGGGAARVNIGVANKYTASEGRKAVAQLRTRNAPGWTNNNYMAIVHPNVSYDLRSDVAVTDVINYQLYQDGAPIKAGSIGTFNGIEYIENPRAAVFAGAGALGVDVYATLVVGRQYLAKAHSRAPGFGPDPKIVFGPVTDVLERFNPIGWYHLVGYGVFREACAQRIESSSSLA